CLPVCPATEGAPVIQKAMLAEQAKYGDMSAFVKGAMEKGRSYPVKTNLLSVACEDVVGGQSAAWRGLSCPAEKLGREGSGDWEKVCDGAVGPLDHLIEGTGDAKSWVFHWKLKGDYTTTDRKHIIDPALSVCQEAIDLSKEMPGNPTGLDLVSRNFMVFSYEIPNSPEQAISLAKTTSDEAMADLHTLTKDSYKDSTFITQGLQDNLVLGTADNTRGEGVRLLRSPRT
uniref:14-3-3 domain-containing protein n=1 Tax=Mustela putorius furo TaxID=9669 RepID=M3YJA7_MUSPF